MEQQSKILVHYFNGLSNEYRLFEFSDDGANKALDWAKSNGYFNPLELDLKVGMRNISSRNNKSFVITRLVVEE